LQQQKAIEKYGEDIGNKFVRYIHGGNEQNRVAFVETVVTVLETGTHEEKVNVLSALLEVFDTRDNNLNNRVQRTEMKDASF